MIESYNLGRRLGKYSLNAISYGYRIQPHPKYISSDPEKPQVIKVGSLN
jgi:hypothetical protein